VAKLSIGKINLRESKVATYFRETWYELKKVSWPSRAEAANLTVMVLVVTVFLSIVLAVMDFAFERGLGLIYQWLG
jgi:preprotein translocase subunit SecE